MNQLASRPGTALLTELGGGLAGFAKPGEVLSKLMAATQIPTGRGQHGGAIGGLIKAYTGGLVGGEGG